MNKEKDPQNLSGVDDIFSQMESEAASMEAPPEVEELEEYSTDTDQEGQEASDEPTSDPEPLPEKKATVSADKSARTLVNALDFVTSASCSAISGRSRKSYKMDKDEKEEILSPLTDWLEVIGANFNPAIAVVIAVLFIVGSKVWQATDDRKEDAEEKAFQEKKAAAKARLREQRAQEQAEQPETTAAAAGQPKKIKRTTRKRFTIDADGFFERDENGQYIQKEDRTEKPTAGELEIIEALMEEKASEKEINKALREYNKAVV